MEPLEPRLLLAGIWISHQAIGALPDSGQGWEALVAAAQPALELPNLHDQDEENDVLTLAKALVAVRLNDPAYRAEVQDTIMKVIGTETVKGTVHIADPTAVETTATFSAPGTYLFQLTADDGDRHDEDEVTVRVHAPGEVYTPTGAAALTGSGRVTIEGTTSTVNNDPEVDAGPQQQVGLHDVVTLRGTVTDDGLPAGTVTTRWEVVEPRTLALGRNLVSYVIAADLVGLQPQQDTEFRLWLRKVLTTEIDGRTLQNTHETRPNNWGTMAGASRAAAAVYLGDRAELDRTAEVFRAFLGDRSAHQGFSFEEGNTWQIDPLRPVGILPKGATQDGQSVDGAMPEDMRRGGPFQIPMIKTNYPWEAMQGALVTAEILYRAGYDSFEWGDRALLRAAEFLYAIGWPPPKSHEWMPWLIDARYGTRFRTAEVIEPGKNMGWTSWTHQFGPPDKNRAPRVDAGADQTIPLHGSAILDGVVRDDGLPDPAAAPVTWWVLQSSPPGGAAQFQDATGPQTTVHFTEPGRYVLKLNASDRELSASDELAIDVLREDELLTRSFQDSRDGYQGTRDTRIRGDFPTTNFGTSDKLEMDGSPDQVSLVRWELEGIPTDSIVTAASLTFHVLNASTQDYEIYEALRPWDELTATFEWASWETPWESPGASGASDRGREVLGSLTAPEIGVHTFDLNPRGIELVQRWVRDPATNRGLVFQDLDNQTSDDLDVSSREEPAAEPRLTITYRLVAAPPPPDPPGAENRPPRVGNDAYTTREDEPLAIAAFDGVLANDSDPDGDPLTATVASPPQHGSLSLAADGSLLYVPHPDYSGSDEFSYWVDDGVLKSSAAVRIDIESVNDLPVAAPIAVQTNADSPVAVTLQASDAEEEVLEFAIVTGPAHGQLEGAGAFWSYRPEPGFSGSDSFDYVASDGVGPSPLARVTITVVEPPPITVNLRDGLLGYGGTRDTRIRGDQPTVTNGTSTRLEIDGRPDQSSLIRWDLEAIPPGSQVLAASLTIHVVNTSIHEYEAYELLRPWDEATATFQQASKGQAWGKPGAADSSDHAADVLATLTAWKTGAATFEFSAEGRSTIQRWIRQPDRNFGIVLQDYSDQTSDDLDFSAREALGQGPMLTITYRPGPPPPPNFPPTATDLTVTTDEDTAVPIDLIGRDPNGDSITFSLESLPAHGTLSGTAPSLVYTPGSHFHGADHFQYRVTDELGVEAFATVSITVASVNDAPVAQPLTLRSDPAGGPVALRLIGDDPDGDSLTFHLLTEPRYGHLEGTVPDLTYFPDPNFTGQDEFTYQVSDGFTVSNAASVTIAMKKPEPSRLDFQYGVSPTPSYTGTRDTKIRGDQATTVQGSSNKLEMDGKPDIAALLYWDLSSIPGGSVIQSAKITVNVVNTSTHSFPLYELLRPWSEATATFKLAASGSPWQVSGAQGAADRGTAVLGSLTGPKLGPAELPLQDDGVAVVQRWVNDPAKNFGFILQDYRDASTDDLEFTSREGSTAELRPKLTVVYEPPSAITVRAIRVSNPLTNHRERHDVNDDGAVTPQDALIVINEIHGREGESSPRREPVFPDVSGDAQVTPLDALLVINWLHRQASGAGEGDGNFTGRVLAAASPFIGPAVAPFLSLPHGEPAVPVAVADHVRQRERPDCPVTSDASLRQGITGNPGPDHFATELAAPPRLEPEELDLLLESLCLDRLTRHDAGGNPASRVDG